MGETFLLTGDMGGTNCRFGLYSKHSDKLIFYKEYSSQEHADPNDEESGGFFKILTMFINDSFIGQANSETCTIIACFACAGPVNDNCCLFTNVADGKFKVDGKEVVENFLCIKAASVVNDFVGMGYGALTLDIAEECICINPGVPIDPTGPIACVGAGTGLGECYLVTTTGTKDGYMCFPSEGGHSDFAPRNDLEIEMFKFIKSKFNCSHRTSIERIASGSGLANVYEFLASKFPDRVDKAVHAQIESTIDMKGMYIAKNAKTGTLCEQAMQIFASAYGAEVSSVAVKFIPTGGLFLTGGLTPKNLKYIQGPDTPFMKSYLDRGRLSHLCLKTPVYAVIPEDLGVRGARTCALRDLRIYEEKQKSVRSSFEHTSKSDDTYSLNNILLAGSCAAACSLLLMNLLQKK